MTKLKGTWKDPVKGIPPKQSTLDTEGDFGEFTDLMKRVVKLKPKTSEEKKPASPAPASA